MTPRRSAALFAALCTGPAAAAPYSATYFFGDSLTDSGYYRPLFGPDASGLGSFTTHPGSVWAELLAGRFGTGAAPANTPGGTDYAQGGARVDEQEAVAVSALLGTQPISVQLEHYLAAHGGRADPAALYTVWGGANDVLWAQGQFNGNAAQAAPYLAVTAGQAVDLILALQRAGAQHVLVPNLPDIGLTPFAATQPGGPAALTAMSEEYNRQLFTQLAAAGIEVIPMDMFHLLREISTDPTRYGFANVTDPACRGSSFLCGPIDLVAPGADRDHLFADSVHPSAAGHQILADYVVAMLAAPGQIGLLAEGPVATRRHLTEALFSAAQTALRSRGQGIWATAGAGSLDFGGRYAGADGTPYAATVGYDRADETGAVGVAVSFDEVRPELSGGGRYRQRQMALSLYGRVERGALGASLAGTIGSLDFDTERRVTLGPARRDVEGSTRGSHLSAAAQVDYELGGERLRHGPFIGLAAGQVHVDGFAESTAAGLSTALAFGSQRRDQLIGRVGYQAAWELGEFTPYARAAYTHDFDAGSRSIAITAPSVFDATYHAVAARSAADGASAVLGSRFRWSPTLAGWVELEGEWGAQRVQSYQVSVGLRWGI